MRGVSESLAGRVGIVNLLGLSLAEIQGKAADHTPFAPLPEKLAPRVAAGQPLDLGALYTRIWRGTFPAIALNSDMDRDLFYSSYVQTYLQRDVRDLANVGNETSFVKFLRAAAARTGQLINLSDMARDANISPNTAKSWLSILETSGIVYLLEPYHSNLTKRLVKAPKLYFPDTGLCAYLTKWSSPETLEAGAMSGAILETWVIAEILKSWWNNGKRPSLYFYRDRDKKEIDLLIDLDNTLYPLEIKKTASPRKELLRHFAVLERLGRTIGPGGLLCMVKTVLPVTKEVNAIPVWAI
jgi:predicted AAA+ superfamily ATPase